MNRYWFLALIVSVGAPWTTLSGQSPLDRKISFSASGEPLDRVLERLIDEHQIALVYSNDVLPADRIINIDVRRSTVDNLLRQLFSGTALTFEAQGNQILIRREETPPRELDLPPIPRQYLISGTVEDAETGEPLIGANLYDPESGRGAATNEYGFFSLRLPHGHRTLLISYTGYQTLELPIMLDQNRMLQPKLKGSSTLNPIVVTSGETSVPLTDRTRSANGELALDVLQRLPTLLGEGDLGRALTLYAGVQTGADGIGGMHIRGGSIDQNLYLLDGVPIYNASHALGFLSVFNTSAVRNARLIKGSFPARYGGRLSSVLDVRTREGNFNRWGGEATLGLLSARASLEGPIVKNRVAIFLSGRQSLLNTYLRPFSRYVRERRGEQGETAYDYYDLNAKLNIKFNQRNHLYFSYYRGQDTFSDRAEESRPTAIVTPEGDTVATGRADFRNARALQYGNTVAALRWTYGLNSQTFLKANLTFSNYRFADDYSYVDSLSVGEQTLDREIVLIRNQSGIRDYAARVELDVVPNDRHYLRVGTEVIQHEFVPGVLALNEASELLSENPDRIFSNDSIQALEFHLFAEDEWQIRPALTLNVGLRATGFSVQARDYLTFQPRLSLRWRSSRRTQITLAYSSLTQFLHLLNSSNIGLTTGLWVPSTARVEPSRSRQIDLGGRWQLRPRWELEVQAYFKQLRNLIEYAEGANTVTDWERNVTAGSGRAYGLETTLRVSGERTNGWIAYTLSRADRQFDRINFGARYPFRYDRRHQLQLALVHRLGQRVELSWNWIYASGLAFTAPANKFLLFVPGQGLPPEVVINRPARNNERMPAYHRLDVNLNWYFKAHHFDHTLSVGLYNAYAKRHPLYFAFRSDPQPDNVFNKEFVVVELLPILPSLSYTVRF